MENTINPNFDLNYGEFDSDCARANLLAAIYLLKR